ncbi:polysaccharide biosynthesis C-terminal domain-containing protein [bacterium]|nr:polysaccharide biosynthesis C-terminal domain-containing protein [bacterium]
MFLASKSTSILKRDVFLYAMKIFTSVIIARKLGPEMLGVFVILSLIPSYAESFGRLKFDIAAVYFLGKQKYRMGEVVLTLNMLALATSGLIVGVIVWQFDWIYGLLFSKTKYDATMLAHFILLQIPVHFLWMNYSYLILHKEDVVTYNRMIIINALVSSLLSITLLLLFDLGLWAVVVSTVLGTLLSLIYGIIALGAIGPTGKLFNRSLIRDLFQYGSKLYTGGLIGHFQAYITNLLTVLYLAPAQVSFFSLARGFGQMMDRVPAALNTILFPQLAKTVDPKEAARIAARAFRLLLVLLIVVAVIAVILIHPTVHLMYGSAFLPLVVPFLILIPGIVLSGATSPFMQYFMSINRPGLAVTLPIFPLAIQVALALLIIPMWGPAGAALAFTTGLVAFSLISCWMFLKLSGCTLRSDLMVRREDILYLWRFSTAEAGKIWKTMKSIRTQPPHA